MFKFRFFSALLAMSILVVMVSPSAARLLDKALVDPGPEATAEARGEFIAHRSDRSDQGFGDSEGLLIMTLRNANGDASERRVRQFTLERDDLNVGDKSISVFDTPRDVAGTALLSHAKILEDDDQWLFLPALNRVKRISSSNKSGPFLGSEFSYEDLTAQEAAKYTHRFDREEACGEFTCDVIVSIPRYSASAYTRLVIWIDQTHFQFHKIEYYDRGEQLFKTLTYSDYQQYGQFWRSKRLEMVNQRTGKSTTLEFSELKFGTGLTAQDFVRGRLSRL